MGGHVTVISSNCPPELYVGTVLHCCMAPGAEMLLERQCVRQAMLTQSTHVNSDYNWGNVKS